MEQQTSSHQITHVIFDMDGVIIDSEIVYIDFFKKVYVDMTDDQFYIRLLLSLSLM